MKKGVHQFVSSFTRRDAIGENALVLQKAFLDMGYDSKIFYFDCSDNLTDSAFPFNHYYQVSSPEDVMIIHYGMKLPIVKPILKLSSKKILVYHNITPAQFFENFAPWLINVCRDSRREVAKLRKHMFAAVGVSNYNTSELNSMGYKNTHTIPLAVDFEKYNVTADSDTLHRYRDDNWTNWLFVGRICPNKKQEDLIKIFYYYQKYFQPKSRLFLVGHGTGMGLYVRYLKGLVEHLGLNHVHFTGSISQSELAALYKIANLFLVMSEHEGFCVPLLESFYYGVPVIGFDSSAVTETLGGAGILVKEKRLAEISGLADYLFQNENLKESLIFRQKQRLTAFRLETIMDRWNGLLESFENRLARRSQIHRQWISAPPKKSAPSENQIHLDKPDISKDSQPNVQMIVDSIKTKAYMEGRETIENRLDHIRKLFEEYSVPDMSQNYPLLRIWPFKSICIIFQRIFRRLYFMHSQSQREAFYLLLDELRNMHIAYHQISRYINLDLKEKSKDE